MNYCDITLSANAGISLQLPQATIWIDALHTDQYLCFDSLTEASWQRMRGMPAFSAPDLICFTHCHKDHYDRTLTQKASTIWPGASIALPQRHFPHQIVLNSEVVHLILGTLDLQFFKLPHKGANFQDIHNYSILIQDPTSSIFISGDSEIAHPKLTDLLQGISVNLAVLAFPWITLRRGRDYLNQVLRPEHVLVYHLPSKYDPYGYVPSLYHCIPQLACDDVRPLTSMFQHEHIPLETKMRSVVDKK